MKTLLIRVLRSLLTFLGGSVPASAPAPSVPITPPSIPASGFPSQRPRMYHVRIITSESRFEGLMEALEHAGITGMTVTRVLGYGLQKGHRGMYTDTTIESKLLPKIQCDLVISKIPPETIVDIAKRHCIPENTAMGKSSFLPWKMSSRFVLVKKDSTPCRINRSNLPSKLNKNASAIQEFHQRPPADTPEQRKTNDAVCFRKHAADRYGPQP